MVIFWSFLIVLVLVLVTCYLVLRVHALNITKQMEKVEEALWGRRHRIPLLLELASDQIGENRQTIIDLRADLQTSIDTPGEKIPKEKELSEIIRHMLDILKQDEKHAVILNALRNEFRKLHDNIEHEINDYNFYIGRWKSLSNWPWFKIFQFAFSEGKNEKISYI